MSLVWLFCFACLALMIILSADKMYISKTNLLRMYYAVGAFAAGYVIAVLFGTQSLVLIMCMALGAMIAGRRDGKNV